MKRELKRKMQTELKEKLCVIKWQSQRFSYSFENDNGCPHFHLIRQAHPQVRHDSHLSLLTISQIIPLCLTNTIYIISFHHFFFNLLLHHVETHFSTQMEECRMTAKKLQNAHSNSSRHSIFHSKKNVLKRKKGKKCK